jgi:hypothetical protein
MKHTYYALLSVLILTALAGCPTPVIIITEPRDVYFAPRFVIKNESPDGHIV